MPVYVTTASLTKKKMFYNFGTRSRSRDRNRGGFRGSSHVERAPPAEPEVGAIYSGKVANITGFGCFIALEGFRRKVEGLVHISQLRKEGRVSVVLFIYI